MSPEPEPAKAPITVVIVPQSTVIAEKVTQLAGLITEQFDQFQAVKATVIEGQLVAAFILFETAHC